MEAVAREFYPVGRSVCGSLATTHAGGGNIGADIKKKRQIRLQPFASETIHESERVKRKTTAITLVCKCGIAEAIRQNPLAGIKRRDDYISHKLSSSRKEQQQLAPVTRRILTLVLEQPPYEFGKASSTWLASQYDLYTFRFEVLGKALHLSRLAATLSTLKCYEPSTHFVKRLSL